MGMMDLMSTCWRLGAQLGFEHDCAAEQILAMDTFHDHSQRIGYPLVTGSCISLAKIERGRSNRNSVYC